jgi:hypothetical protein
VALLGGQTSSGLVRGQSLWIKQQQICTYSFRVRRFFFCSSKPHLCIYTDFEGTMDSPGIDYSFFGDEQADLDLPTELSDIDHSCSSSPREHEFPESSCFYSSILSCPPSWLELRPQLEDDIHQVPLSSSSPEFTSSSPTSDISSELGKEGSSSLTSASSSSRSETASISSPQHFDCELRPDQFSQRLHELLLLVLRGRELLRSSTEGTDCTTCTSRSDDSNQGSDNQVPQQTRYYFCAYMH